MRYCNRANGGFEMNFMKFDNGFSRATVMFEYVWWFWLKDARCSNVFFLELVRPSSIIPLPFQQGNVSTLPRNVDRRDILRMGSIQWNRGKTCEVFLNRGSNGRVMLFLEKFSFFRNHLIGPSGTVRCATCHLLKWKRWSVTTGAQLKRKGKLVPSEGGENQEVLEETSE